MNLHSSIPISIKPLLVATTVLLSAAGSALSAAQADDRIDIDRASWSNDRNRLSVRGDKAPRRTTVTIRYGNRGDNGAVIGTTQSDSDGDWSFQIGGSALGTVPCDVTAQAAGVDDDDREVRRAPNNCSNDVAAPPPPPAAECSDGIDNDGDGLIDFPADPGCVNADDNDEFNAPPPPVAQCADGIDNDGDGLIDFPADPGCVNADDNDEFNAPPPPPPVAQCADGVDNDGDGLVDFPNDPGCVNADDNDEADVPPPPVPNTSINSTSRNGTPAAAVEEQPFSGQNAYSIFSTNDLGMHCGDLDTRISSILPPFNTVHSQVIQRGSTPTIMTPADGVEVVYSAASNPNDPILSGINSAGSGPVASSMLGDGSVYKTNFWEIARDAYRAFYPAGILDAFYPAGTDVVDLGLPMPNVEQLYLGDGNLSAEQQEMNGRAAPYLLNDPLAFKIFALEQPFFLNFPFGYTSHDVNWYEAAGIPLTAYDDFGRENPWPLMRVQARAGGQVLASVDTVVPISGEANCGQCHNAEGDGVGTGVATNSLGTNVTLSIDDEANVPFDVSLEWAADINILRLHDQKHNTNLIVGTDLDDPINNSDVPFKSVVCQSCHYTPALDLAQLGPRGPENDGPLVLNGVEVSPSIANGADQVKHRSMSNVMHRHHGSVTDDLGNRLFPDMPPAVNPDGSLRDPVAAREVLMQTCYQCHPGRRTDCLRGAMANGGMLCQDCHGNMEQVGSDFTNNVSPSNPGAFVLGSDFYTNPATPRVPWANEPGCGSCHTGDANNNMSASADTVTNPADVDGNSDGIRLRVAYRVDANGQSSDGKAMPIVPTNKRFAENTVDDPTKAAFGNPMLYRVSKGHGGVFCEACHGATHGIWPNKNPNANDNVASNQIQGHSGTIIECSACHTGDLGNTLNGPHGMHPVGATRFADGGHENLAKDNPDACRACHGQNGQGTVLSRTATDRDFRGMEDGGLVAKGTPVTCTMCHGNEL